MFDFRGNNIESAGPSTPISVMGLSDVPSAGDLIRVVETDKEARTIVAERQQREKEASKAAFQAVTLENMFERFQEGQLRELRLIVKRLSDGHVIFNIDESNLDFWRGEDASHFVRPKWGIYRSLLDPDNLRPDEEDVRFANFSIREVRLVN